MNEPQKRFPKVSNCHRAELGVSYGGEGTNFYYCTQEDCRQPCNAVPDEGLEEKKCKCPLNRGIKGHEVYCPLGDYAPLPPPDAKEEKRVMEQIIQKAYEGGLDKAEYSNLPSLLLKPVFWQSLGKAMDWGNEKINFACCDWKWYWHSFIDHLAFGKSIESFFEQF